jgi:hypothetical protein
VVELKGRDHARSEDRIKRKARIRRDIRGRTRHIKQFTTMTLMLDHVLRMPHIWQRIPLPHHPPNSDGFSTAEPPRIYAMTAQHSRNSLRGMILSGAFKRMDLNSKFMDRVIYSSFVLLKVMTTRLSHFGMSHSALMPEII